MIASIRSTCRATNGVGSTRKTAVNWVIVNTKTRSKNSSSVETRCARGAGFMHRCYGRPGEPLGGRATSMALHAPPSGRGGYDLRGKCIREPAGYLEDMSAASQETAVGVLLRHWRLRRRRSQLDLALDAGISARHLSFAETGR